VNTTGDGFFAAFDGPGRAARFGRAAVDIARNLGIDARVGIHTGECEARGDDLSGIAVHVGARVAAQAAAGEVLATSIVRDLVTGSDLEFDDRGARTLKGIAGAWPLFAVVVRDG
jgi:class 3 adenylate cyclase